MSLFVFYHFLLTFLCRVHLKNSSNPTMRKPGTKTLVFQNHQLKMVISGFNGLIFHCVEYICKV